MAGDMDIRVSGLTAESPFSYVCHRCRRCCVDKLIQVNPYEIARLARGQGITTTAFLRDFVEPDRPYLRRRDDGSCVFLGPAGCTVHADRPLVCRVYPLGRHVIAGEDDASARYSVVHGHPESAGEFGEEGTVASYLRGQGIETFSSAAAAYLDALQAWFDAWRALPPAQREIDEADPSAEAGTHGAMTVLDVDRAVVAHCAAAGVEEPATVDARVALHLDIIRGWARGDGDHQTDVIS